MPSVTQLLNDIRTRLPHSTDTFTDSVIIGWMNDTQNEIWRYMASTEVYEFNTVAGQALYTLPSNLAFDRIKTVVVSNSTVLDGEEGYQEYTYAGPDDELVGSQYYDALNNIGLYPEPSSDTGAGFGVKITYESSPTQLSTTTLTTIPDVNVEYQDILKWRALRDISGSGNNPDLTIASYYQRLYGNLYKVIKLDYFKRKSLKSKQTWRYNDGWWKG